MICWYCKETILDEGIYCKQCDSFNHDINKVKVKDHAFKAKIIGITLLITTMVTTVIAVSKSSDHDSMIEIIGGSILWGLFIGVFFLYFYYDNWKELSPIKEINIRNNKEAIWRASIYFITALFFFWWMILLIIRAVILKWYIYYEDQKLKV